MPSAAFCKSATLTKGGDFSATAFGVGGCSKLNKRAAPTPTVVLTIDIPSTEPPLIFKSLSVAPGERLLIKGAGNVTFTGLLDLNSQSQFYKSVAAPPVNANCAEIAPDAIFGLEDTDANIKAAKSVTFVTISDTCTVAGTVPSLSTATVSSSTTCYTITSTTSTSGQIGFNNISPGSPQTCPGAALPPPAPAPAQDLGWIAAIVIILLLLIVFVIAYWKRDEIKDKFTSARNPTGVASTPTAGNRETATEIPAPPFTVTAIADYTAVDTTQMSLTKGVQYEVVRVAEGNYWFQSKKPNGKLGWFPASYARIESD
jgi:hypothetical protein